MIIAISSTSVYAGGYSDVSVYSNDFVTNDIESTYIEGEVEVAEGQDIFVDQGLKTVAQMTIPDTGSRFSFRLKIPPACLNEDSSSVFRVYARSSGSVIKSIPVEVKVTYKPKQKQTITAAQTDYSLSYPGIRVGMDAESSSGSSLRYSSADPGIVDIDENGNLVPKGVGSTEVSIIADGTERYDSSSKTVKVSVEEGSGYVVTFHSSIDGEEDQVEDQLFDVGKSEALEENPFTNGDHEFLGWADEDGGVYSYADAQSVVDLAKDGESKDLYAIWSGDGAIAAAAWGIKIANDNSFSYGARPATSCPGCYFCGTNRRNKPKGYEKTYVCMTFVHACFAHGTEDPEMLADCKAGKYTVSLHDWNFKHWSCWEKVGRCGSLSVNDLKPGDVIIWWADNDFSGHASLYIGNGDIVDAGRVGWGADTIAVRKGAAAKYLRTGARMDKRSYVMRYVGPNA